MMVDALLYCEVAGYAEYLRMDADGPLNALFSKGPGRSINQIGKRAGWRHLWQAIGAAIFRWLIPAAFLLGIAESAPDSAIVLSILYAALLIRGGAFKTFAASHDQKAKSWDLLAKMSVVYEEFGRRPIAPGYIVSLLSQTAALGASWPQAAYALLARASASGRHLWPIVPLYESAFD